MATLKKLNIIGACNDGADYFNQFDTSADFVKNCHIGDWIIWLFARTNPDDLKRLTLAKSFCAATVINKMPDKRSIDAVHTGIMFGLGFRTKEQLKTASDAANAAYDTSSAASSYAAYSSYAAAAYAIDASAAASSAANAAANVANATYADNVAKKQNQQLTSDFCRKLLPIEIWNFGE